MTCHFFQECFNKASNKWQITDLKEQLMNFKMPLYLSTLKDESYIFFIQNLASSEILLSNLIKRKLEDKLKTTS